MQWPASFKSGSASKPGTVSKGTKSAPASGSGAVYRVVEAGVVEKLADDKTTHFTSVASDGDKLFVTTGKDRRVFSVSDAGLVLYADVAERMVQRFAKTESGGVFVASDSAAFYTEAGKQEAATWISEPFDAEVNSRFGQIGWRGNGPVKVMTRSGNTAKPDGSWSKWSSPITSPGPIRSAAARYLQVKVEITKDSELYALEAYYLPANLKAVVSSIALKKRDGKTGKYSLAWEVKNPDSDQLRYQVRFFGASLKNDGATCLRRRRF